MPSNSGGGAGAERTVRVVYEVDAEGALEAQQRMDAALGQTSEALDEQADHVADLESAHESMADVATRAEQVQQRLQQATQQLASGLSSLSSLLGTESDSGRIVGQMGHFASTGIQLGSALGSLVPVIGTAAGGAAGGVTGALLGLMDAMTPVAPAIREITTEAQASSDAAIEMADAFVGAGDRMREFVDSVSTQSRSRGLQDLNAQITEISDRIAALSSGGSALERLDLPGLRERLASLTAESEATRAGLESEEGEIARGRRAARRGGGRATEDPRFALARGRGGDDAIAFALGLGDDGRPSDFDVELAGRQRPGGPGSGLRQGAAMRAEEQALERLADKRKEEHEAQLERIQAEVDAWTAAGEKIGSTLYGAFTTAVSGQESFDVAMVKGFKSLAIQFGGQMVNEGIAALLTAVGNTVANPPMAATKAAEGAGKLALGIGLGAAGAAIPVPSSGGSTQAPTPRLGPASGDGAVGGSVIVNMNAPAVVTGSRAAVGREIGGALIDARNRFGRV